MTPAIIAALPPPLVCQVVRVHDGDGPLWCRSGVKIRVAGVQAPDFGSATCIEAASLGLQRLLSNRLHCRGAGTTYKCVMPAKRCRILSCVAS